MLFLNIGKRLYYHILMTCFSLLSIGQYQITNCIGYTSTKNEHREASFMYGFFQTYSKTEMLSKLFRQIIQLEFKTNLLNNLVHSFHFRLYLLLLTFLLLLFICQIYLQGDPNRNDNLVIFFRQSLLFVIQSEAALQRCSKEKLF